MVFCVPVSGRFSSIFYLFVFIFVFGLFLCRACISFTPTIHNEYDDMNWKLEMIKREVNIWPIAEFSLFASLAISIEHIHSYVRVVI